MAGRKWLYIRFRQFCKLSGRYKWPEWWQMWIVKLRTSGTGENVGKYDRPGSSRKLRKTKNFSSAPKSLIYIRLGLTLAVHTIHNQPSRSHHHFQKTIKGTIMWCRWVVKSIDHLGHTKRHHHARQTSLIRNRLKFEKAGYEWPTWVQCPTRCSKLHVPQPPLSQTIPWSFGGQH